MADGGILSLPAGLRGWALADEQRSQREARNVGMLSALVGLQGALAEQSLLPYKVEQLKTQAQMTPLQLEQLRLQVDRARDNNVLLRNLFNGGGMRGALAAPQQALTEGAAQGDLGPTVTNAARIPGILSATPNGTLNAGRFGNLPDAVAALLVSGDSGLANLGKVLAEDTKATDTQRDLRASGITPGSPAWNAALTTRFSQQGVWKLNPDGSYTLDPNFARGMGDIKRAEAGAQAGFDVIELKQPDGSTVQIPRSEAVRILGGQGAAPAAPRSTSGFIPSSTVISPDVQMQRDRERLAILENEARLNPNDPALRREIAGLNQRLSTGAPFGIPQLGRSQSPGAKATDEAFGKELGQLGGEIVKGGDVARNQLTNISAMRQALQSVKEAGGATGALAPMVQRATEIAQGFGIDPAKLGLPKDAGPLQIMDALTNKMAMAMIGPGGMPANNFSEADRNFVVATNARKVDTEQGFLAKLEVAEKVARRAEHAEQSLLQALSEGKSVGQWRMEWSRYVNSNPLFPKTDVDAAIRDAKPRAKSFDAMPKANTSNKGMQIRDTTTGKVYESNGMQWKEVR